MFLVVQFLFIFFSVLYPFFTFLFFFAILGWSEVVGPVAFFFFFFFYP